MEHLRFSQSQSQETRKRIQAALAFIRQRPGISEDRLGTLLDCPIGPESDRDQRISFTRKVRGAVDWLAEQGYIQVDSSPVHQYRKLHPVEPADPESADLSPSTDTEAIDPDSPLPDEPLLWNGTPVAKGSIEERVLLALRQIETDDVSPTLTNVCDLARIPTGSFYKRQYAEVRPYIQAEIARIKAERNGSNGSKARTIALTQPPPQPDLMTAIDELQSQCNTLSQRNQELEERNQELRQQLGETIASQSQQTRTYEEHLRDDASHWRRKFNDLTDEMMQLQADLDAVARNYDATQRLLTLLGAEPEGLSLNNLIYLPPNDRSDRAS